MDDTFTPEDIQGTEPELETVVPGAAEPEAEPADDLDPDAPEGETPEPEPKQKPSGVEKRVSELTYHRRQAERREAKAAQEAAYWRGIAEARGGAAQTPQVGQQPAKEAGPPKQENFETYDEYLRALTRHEIGAELAQERQRLSKEAETRQAETHQEQTFTAFQSRAEAFRAKQPDFDFEEIASNEDLHITPTMAQVVYNSGDGPELAHYLQKYPEHASNIAKLPPNQQVFMLGQLSQWIAPPAAAPKSRPASAAPAPITPVKAAAKAIEGLTDNTPIGAWMAQRGKEVRKR